MPDLDGIPLPESLSVSRNPEECVKWAADHLLPTEFRQASFVYQLSSSAGLIKLDNELNVHLWVITDQGYGNDELRSWARWWNARQQRKILDPALYNAVQPHYITEPELLDRLIDPLAGRRLGLVHRDQRTVHLYMPSEDEVAAELGSRQKRALNQFKRARKISATEDRSDLRDEETPEANPEQAIEGEPLSEEPYFDAVKIGHGWQGYLNAIGFEGHIRAQILAAVGSYFYEHGSRGDRDHLKAAIEKAIEESPFLDCGEPWSRPRADARDYLAAPPSGKSNVDEMIADIAMRQAETERLANHPCDTEWALPTFTANEAFEQINDAIQKAVRDAAMRRYFLEYKRDMELVFPDPPRTAVNCSPGTGKTEAMVRAVALLLALDNTARVAITVPTHKLGQGLADRINRAFGSDVAAEWYGIDYPDPSVLDKKMCRIAESAREVISGGGKLQLLCSRRGNLLIEYCSHHPRVAGTSACGYQRQQASEVTSKTRVWIIPATMLADTPPLALRRMPLGRDGDFDLLVIDEAPWFNLVKEPLMVPVERFSAVFWEAEQARIGEDQKQTMLRVFAKIYETLSRQPVGEVPVGEFAAAEITQFELSEALRSAWRYKIDLRDLVEPGMRPEHLKKAIAAIAARNRCVIETVEALRCIWLYLAGKLAPSGMILKEARGQRYLCVQRRKEIDPAWLRAPTLYLDAADLGSFQIAQAWLPGLDLRVNARAKAPHMRAVQLVDSEMSYSRLVRRGNGNETVRNNQEKVARIIRNLGPDGLVICPNQLRLDWEKAKALPAGWMVWNFGEIRGRDDGKAVTRLVVVSRPVPSAAVVEAMAEIIFARRVEKLPEDRPYPKKPVGRLMTDGTGTRAFASRHPDPLVEAVRFALCEGELLQAVGRGRGVRRTAEAPLEVLLLTNVPIPIPIDRLISWKELNDGAGPLHQLFAKGVVPLDYAGMAAALPDRFSDAANIREWFRYRRDALSALKALRGWARDPDGVDLRTLCKSRCAAIMI